MSHPHRVAAQMGYDVTVLTAELSGDARAAAAMLADRATHCGPGRYCWPVLCAHANILKLKLFHINYGLY